ncbi:MAG: hypothetical protein DCF31_01885 [Alphaproteobacteria bacterium]|nr:MAG: hypothetical protein DCF31_01885 [Alphaproteobacteria bacterium]
MAKELARAVWRLVAGLGLMALLAATGMAKEPLPPRKASPLTVRQIHSGHSLSDAYGSNPWPGRLTLATARRTGDRARDTIHRSITPGSSLAWRWEHPTDKPDARQDIDAFELLVITESVPLSVNDMKATTLDWLDRWVRHAGTRGNAGKGTEVMLYSSWIYWRHSGTPPDYDHEAAIPFRKRLDIDGARWERMQDSANANRPAGMPPVYMIPGHRLMMRIHDDIAGGRAPGLRSIGDIFADDIHLNDIGQYAITCLVYAVIYQRDPAELPDRLAPADRLIPSPLVSDSARGFPNRP